VVQPVEGLKGAAFRFPIEEGKILEFVEALHGNSDEWRAGVMPPTFLTSAFFWEARVAQADVKEPVDFDPSRSVHAEQIFEFHGPPPRANDVLTTQSRVDRIYTKTNRAGALLTFVDVVTEYHDQDGTHRASSTMRAIEFPEEKR
jgi:hypothetical protein